MKSHPAISWQPNGTPRTMENHQTNLTRILVARHYQICQSLHTRMHHMPNHKDTTTNQSTNQAQQDPWRDMGNNHHGFHCRPPSITRIWQHPHSHWLSQQSHILSPCHKTIMAEQTSQLLVDNIWKRTGIPKAIISDWGPQFAAQVTQELWRKLGIKQKLSTVFHPQTDSKLERVNQVIKQYLCICGNFQQDN